MMYRGISKGATGNFIAAVSDLEKATRLAPRNPQAWFNLGVALTKMKRYDEAVKSYSAAIKLNPGNSSFYLQRGIAALMQGNTSQSCNDFRMAVKLGNSKAREFAVKYCR
jgi:Flp pilus assembly protein TadD